MINRSGLFLFLLTLTGLPSATRAAVAADVPQWQSCFVVAGHKYGIDPLLLEAIARQESGLNPLAVNDRNTDGSSDYGLMQINTLHIPGLVREGLISGYRDLLTRPCLNIQIGARLLARHFQRCGVNWNCLGSYNAGFADTRHRLRERYADRVWPRYRELLRERRGGRLL